ncbi:MAG: hypothetical protein R3Y64_09665 [Peptostreptococcaceae bacterium]
MYLDEIIRHDIMVSMRYNLENRTFKISKYLNFDKHERIFRIKKELIIIV